MIYETMMGPAPGPGYTVLATACCSEMAMACGDGEGVFIDFRLEDPAKALRVAIHREDAERMLRALQELADPAQRKAPPGPMN